MMNSVEPQPLKVRSTSKKMQYSGALGKILFPDKTYLVDSSIWETKKFQDEVSRGTLRVVHTPQQEGGNLVIIQNNMDRCIYIDFAEGYMLAPKEVVSLPEKLRSTSLFRDLVKSKIIIVRGFLINELTEETFYDEII